MSLRALSTSRWLRLLAGWTLLIGFGIALLWPAATTRPAPCNYIGAINQDPGLPPCPVDDINVAAVFVVLLVIVWALGVGIEAMAFTLRGLVRLGRRTRDSSQR